MTSEEVSHIVPVREVPARGSPSVKAWRWEDAQQVTENPVWDTVGGLQGILVQIPLATVLTTDHRGGKGESREPKR